MSGGGGYDFSVAVSDAATIASNAGAGPFTVGGGKSSGWIALALIALLGLGVWLYFRK